MKVEENTCSRAQLACLRDIYKFMQESDSQAKLSNSDDVSRIEALLNDFGDLFPFLKPLRKFRLQITQDIELLAHDEENCEELLSEIDWGLHHERLVDSEFCDYAILDQ